jgi:hypothetical protein
VGVSAYRLTARRSFLPLAISGPCYRMGPIRPIGDKPPARRYAHTSLLGLLELLMYGCLESMKVENLRSPYVKTGSLYYFARMIDKIRLNAANLLPGEYQQVLGLGFDGRTCRFLRIDYQEFVGRVLEGGTDEELLQWSLTRGRTPTEEEIAMWNDWVRKKGWRDETSARLEKRLKESGFEDRTDIETMFDYIDLDEGRDPRHRNRGHNGEYE